MAAATSYTSQILIQELPTTGQGRSLILNGPGLPFMGAEWAMKANVITTWYQGNGDEATQQTLGPQELPSRWEGDWKRTLLGKTPCLFIDTDGSQTNVIGPKDLWDLFEDFARLGYRLRVDWIVSTTDNVQLSRVTREGRLTELKFKPDRLQDIKWEMQFDWASRGTPTPVKVTNTRANTVNTDSAAYLQKVQALVQSNLVASLQSLQPSNLTLGQIEAFANLPTTLMNGLANKVQQITSEMSDLASIAATLQSQPVQIANRAVDLARDTVSQINSVYDTFSGIPYETQTTKSNVADFIRSMQSFAQTSDQAQDAARAGQQFAAKLEQQIQSYLASKSDPTRLSNPNFVKQAYITKDGDTPERVSQRFYNTPDHAVDILRANKLSWYTPSFTKGTVLIIPELPSQNPTQGV